MVFEIRVEFGQIAGIYAGLLLFGLAFDQVTAWIERSGYLEGFTSLLVAAGVIFTVAPFLFLSMHFALAVLGGFVASGSPMIVGSIIRYAQQRERARKEIARLHSYDNEPQGMAR
jgi:hypothetical protein